MYEQYQELWNKTLNKLSLEFDKNEFEEIFKPVNKVYKFQKNLIYVVAPSQFHKSRIESFHIRQVVRALNEISGENLDVKIITEDFIANDTTVPINGIDPNINNLYRHNLKAIYTFENYVVGTNNRFANLVALQVANQPGKVANPLYIFGGVGLGKTHLMQAIGNFILDNDPKKKILYVKTEIFIEDFVKKLKNEDDFNQKYNDIDVLLIDDIQFLSKKEQSQLEFFKIFEKMHNENKQIVVTSDRPAFELKDIMDRLTSRFEWGAQVDIKEPDVNTRIDILRKKLASEKIGSEEISIEVLEYIACNFTSNIRILEGAIKRVLFYSTMMNKEITVELTKEALKDVIPEIKRLSNTNVTHIQKTVSSYYNITLENLLSNSRKANFVLPRQIAMYLTRDLLGSSYPKIGSDFGGKDHTTVMHSIQKIDNLRIINNQVDEDIKKLLSKLK
ncbi:MAG: chromosomal replication initiator DnaA [Haloplasmataceae bacterium]|jgi:chromosomal replication initiator protein|nr:chromosomal replication initiator DnaA [Haloplasmataceae bacterium]